MMRIGIGLTAALLLACGASAMAIGVGLGGELAGRPLLDPALARYSAGNEWFLPVVAGAAEFAGLTGLAWLVRQVRLLVEERRPAIGGPARTAAESAAGVLLREARELPGVCDARMRLAGTSARPRLLMNLVCAGDAVLGEVYGELGAGPVERYRNAVGLPDLPVVVRFRLTFPETETA